VPAVPAIVSTPTNGSIPGFKLLVVTVSAPLGDVRLPTPGKLKAAHAFEPDRGRDQADHGAQSSIALIDMRNGRESIPSFLGRRRLAREKTEDRR